VLDFACVYVNLWSCPVFALLGNNPILFLLLRGWQYAGKHRKNIIFYAVLLAGATVVSLCEPYVIGRALNAVQTDNVTSTGGGRYRGTVTSGKVSGRVVLFNRGTHLSVSVTSRRGSAQISLTRR